MTDPLHVVVTGANRGIGLEFVRQLAARGHRILATCREPDRAADLLALASRHGDAIQVTECDVANAGSCAALAAVVPWDRVDLLLLNAGVLGGEDDDLENADLDELEPTFRINAVGPLRVVRALWHKLGVGSKVVALSSQMASIADNSSGGRYAYRMSKAALNMAIRCLGFDCAPRRIVAVALSPGWVRTDMGGGAAPLAVEESVASMLATIDSRTVAHNGGFFDRDGEVLPW